MGDSLDDYFDDLDCEESVTFTARFKHETDQALLVDYCDKDIWVPKSQILNQFSCGDYKPFSLLQLKVKEWFAIEKEII